MITMTRQQFEVTALRRAEQALGLPSGWWGNYSDVEGPNGVRVRFSRSCWVLRQHGKIISKHDSRAFAIAKGRKLP